MLSNRHTFSDQWQTAAKDYLDRHHTSEHYFEEGGQYLPLSVWDRKGFNIDDIRDKSLPEDRIEHGVLGRCFRVRLLSKGTIGRDIKTQGQNLAGGSRKRKHGEGKGGKGKGKGDGGKTGGPKGETKGEWSYKGKGKGEFPHWKYLGDKGKGKGIWG